MIKHIHKPNSVAQKHKPGKLFLLNAVSNFATLQKLDTYFEQIKIRLLVNRSQ